MAFVSFEWSKINDSPSTFPFPFGAPARSLRSRGLTVTVLVFRGAWRSSNSASAVLLQSNNFAGSYGGSWHNPDTDKSSINAVISKAFIFRLLWNANCSPNNNSGQSISKLRPNDALWDILPRLCVKVLISICSNVTKGAQSIISVFSKHYKLHWTHLIHQKFCRNLSVDLRKFGMVIIFNSRVASHHVFCSEVDQKESEIVKWLSSYVVW